MKLTGASPSNPPQRRLVTGVQKLGPGRLEVLQVAEAIGGELVAAGPVRFGFAGKGLWSVYVVIPWA